MSFRIRRDNNWYLQDTSIENIYINEYMVSAPGDYVKVFLYARMHAEIGSEISNAMIAMELGMAEEDVLKAWNYWESKGAIRKCFDGQSDRFNYDVEFISLKSAPGLEKKEEPERNVLADDELNGLMLAIEPILGRTLNLSDREAAKGWIEDYYADPEVVIYACKVAAEKEITTTQYITGIIRRWTEAGLRNADEVEAYIKENDERHYLYRRVFRALGFNRQWTENEKKIMDVWFDDYGFAIDRVLEACDKSSGISNPNINYVNKILENWHEENEKSKAGGGPAAGRRIANSQVLKYYEYIRNKQEQEAKARKQEIYEKLPEIAEFDENMQKLNVQMSKAMFGPAGAQRDQIINELKQKMDDINVQKAILLTENNYPYDYMDVKHLCEECQDTGVTVEGQRCSCFKQRTQEAIEWQKKTK